MLVAPLCPERRKKKNHKLREARKIKLRPEAERSDAKVCESNERPLEDFGL